jgi:hypothetical protein
MPLLWIVTIILILGATGFVLGAARRSQARAVTPGFCTPFPGITGPMHSS